MNMWAWTLSSQPHSGSQRGPESRALTLLFPARGFSLWHKPFMARETGASSQKCIERSTVTFQRAKACQPQPSFHLSSIYLMAYIWPSHSGPLLLVAEATPLKKILAQSILIFSGPLSLLLFSLKWAQIDKMESFLLGTDFGNQRTLGKPGPHLSPPHHVHRHAKFQEGNLFPLQFYDTSTAWLSHFMAICIVMGLRQMKQIAIKCWEYPKSWLCLACWMMPLGLNSDGLVQFAAKSHTALNGCHWLVCQAAWWLLNEAN